MSTANSTPQAPAAQLSSQILIEQRLDAIDQALLGLLPRQDRLAAVAQVETRIRELASTSAVTLLESPAASGAPSLLPQLPFYGAASGAWFSGARKKRSRLAVTAGVLGILALALMFATPVTYLFVATVGEALGEFAAYAILGAHVFAITIGGLAAVGLGLAALVKLKRRHEELAGHGWAITGLCAGPLPLLAGCAAVLYIGLELGAVEYFTSGQSVACYPSGPPMSDSQDGNGPVAMSVPPTAGPVAPQFQNFPTPTNFPAPIQSIGHEVPVGAYPAPAMETGDVVPANARPSNSPRLEHDTQENSRRPSEPQPAPHPEPPADPVDMPESAPSITQTR